MTRAQQIATEAHTAGQIRREAQRWCAGSITGRNREEYRFTDGSRIVIIGNRVATQEPDR